MLTLTQWNQLQIEPEVRHLYYRAYLKGWLKRSAAALTGRPRRLVDLATVIAPHSVLKQHTTSVQPVMLRQICGSASPTDAFDQDFNPLQLDLAKHWLQIATTAYQGGTSPPVELDQVGECYFVRNDHYRISVAQALQQHYVDAVVTVWQVEERPGQKSAPTLAVALK